MSANNFIFGLVSIQFASSPQKESKESQNQRFFSNPSIKQGIEK
jgi:hypothetical protein